MLVFLSFTDMIGDSIRSQLQELYTSLYVSSDLDPYDSSDDTLQTLHAEICARKEKSRTLCAGEICPGRSCFIQARMKRQESLCRNIMIPIIMH